MVALLLLILFLHLLFRISSSIAHNIQYLEDCIIVVESNIEMESYPGAQQMQSWSMGQVIIAAFICLADDDDDATHTGINYITRFDF